MNISELNKSTSEVYQLNFIQRKNLYNNQNNDIIKLNMY